MRPLTRHSVQGDASALGKRGDDEGRYAKRIREQRRANRQFALGAHAGVERARVHAALATCPESDYHAAAESERSAFFIEISLYFRRLSARTSCRGNSRIEAERKIRRGGEQREGLFANFICRGTIAERRGLLGGERIRRKSPLERREAADFSGRNK